MTERTGDTLLADAQRLSIDTQVSLFQGMNLVLLKHLETVEDLMTDLQKKALSTASAYWRSGLGSSQDLDDAGTAVWRAMNQKSPDGSIIGVEVHLSRALLGVLAPEPDENWTEFEYCREVADWFEEFMWNWCDLSVDECLCLSSCLKKTIRANRFSHEDRLRASQGARDLQKAEPGDRVVIGRFAISVPENTAPEQPAVFGDLSIIGTSVRHMVGQYSDKEAITATKATPAAWARLKKLFSQ
jgi:hypothetical protein